MKMTVARGTQILLTLGLLLACALPARAHGTDSIQLPIDTPAEAHDAVTASGAPFADFVLLDGTIIGASQFYEVKGEPGSSAAWIVVYTYGWGDCQAGCISRHTFVYQVDPVTGAVTFDGQDGEALPADAPEGLRLLEARGTPGVVVTPATPAPTEQPIPGPTALPVPGVDDTDWAALYEEWYDSFVATLSPCAPDVDPTDPSIATCLLPDGTVAGPMPVFAPAPGPGPDGGGDHGDDGWVHELPTMIFAVLFALVVGAALVGWRKSRA